MAIFVDSEFFHGKDWETRKKPQTNAEFWIKKTERNIQRDIEVNTYLESQNWKILRFWSNDVKKNLDACILQIQNTINERQNTKQKKPLHQWLFHFLNSQRQNKDLKSRLIH
ncbi:MAG: DUF559 domain-containing protein [Flavobacterium sp.]|uniref:DUF559 domain-containing protein n=1 Tax=Flavobacterium sp. TaxID=239 RepID=UPI002FC6014C